MSVGQSVANAQCLAYTLTLAVRPTCGFLPFTQNIFRHRIPENSCLFPPFHCGCPYEKKISKNFVLSPRRSLLGHPVQKYFYYFILLFCFDKKNLLTNPNEIIFRYIFQSFWTLTNFLKDIQKLRFWFSIIFLKRSNFDAFFRPSNLKTKNLKIKKNKN